MKKIITVKLIPNSRQEEALKHTVVCFREICNWFSEKAFESKKFNKIVLQKEQYKECRKRFEQFSSQLIVRAISVVCDSYKKDKRNLRIFRKDTVVYDARVISWKNDEVSIWTIDGRLKIPIRIWNKDLFGRVKGETDLIYKNGKWILSISIDIPDIPLINPKGWLGVDLGIVNLATVSNGMVFSGEEIEKIRQKYFNYHQRLQIKNTKSSRRRIRKTKNKEAKFRRNTNHIISKKIVQCAYGTSYGIALENLKGINKRLTVIKRHRAKHSGWAFAQLRGFIEYKSREVGVPIQTINPKNTSKECSVCGNIDSANRKSQSEFLCNSCSHKENADLNASKNIAFRATVNWPIASQESRK